MFLISLPGHITFMQLDVLSLSLLSVLFVQEFCYMWLSVYICGAVWFKCPEVCTAWYLSCGHVAKVASLNRRGDCHLHSHIYVSAIYTPVSMGEIGSECLHLLSCHHTQHTSISAAACFISCTILHFKCNVMCVCILCVLCPSSACLLMYPDLLWSGLHWMHWMCLELAEVERKQNFTPGSLTTMIFCDIKRCYYC